VTLFSNSAFGPPYKTIFRLGTQTEPNYLFGTFDTKTQPWLFEVTNVALTSDVATVTGTLRSGGGPTPLVAPQVGAKMGVQGTQSNAGLFNVDPATVTAVSWNAQTGVASISFALTAGNVSSTADVGTMVVKPYETPDLVSAGSSSAAAALIFTPDESDNSRCLFAEAKWTGTMPTAATVVLQVANVDDDSRFMTVGNIQGCAPGGTVAASDALATVASSAVTQSGAQYSFIAGKFIRAKVLSMTGGDGTTGLVVSVFA
jgi:hypothetical protein